MAREYRAIVDAGFVLQLDCPDLALSRHMVFAH
jgi:5-methyltetrahydropteroyltriglutamate--homocysteine methyltransferase